VYALQSCKSILDAPNVQSAGSGLSLTASIQVQTPASPASRSALSTPHGGFSSPHISSISGPGISSALVAQFTYHPEEIAEYKAKVHSLTQAYGKVFDLWNQRVMALQSKYDQVHQMDEFDKDYRAALEGL
jgi:hypothetical protein